MVDFAGWDMPIQYKPGIIAEHVTVRTGAGLFDLSHMGRLRFSGLDALAFVQYLTANDVSRLANGRAQYSLCCADDGGVLDDIVVYRLDSEVLMVVNASNRLKILARIETLRAAHHWEFSLVDETVATAMIGIQGPQAEGYLQKLSTIDLSSIKYYSGASGEVNGIAGLIARTGYTGEDGFELIVPSSQAVELWQLLQRDSDGVSPSPCGLGARDTLRLEAGMALYGHELDETVTPYDAGLGRVVKLEKGDFAGRDALARISAQGPKRRLVAFELTEQGVPRQGYPVLAQGSEVGAVTSGNVSPTLHKPIGMAYVTNDREWAPGSEVQIGIRGRSIPAVIVPLPFYTHRTKRG
jgi:aminomethyltransferase